MALIAFHGCSDSFHSYSLYTSIDDNDNVTGEQCGVIMFPVNFRLVNFMKLRKISLPPCGLNSFVQESLRKTVSIR